MQKINNYINGNESAPLNDHWLENFEPASGEIYSMVADSDEKDVALAVNAAEAAYPAWRALAPAERAQVLTRIAELIDRDLTQFAKAESKDNGKPLSMATSIDIPRASKNFQFFAQAITQFSSESTSDHAHIINYTRREPLGVVACISPWNLPLYLFSWKIAPALATGNCVIAKPSELTPMTAFMLGKICTEAGLPAGVLNIIQGSGSRTGNAIISQAKIKAISFTGGTVTGKHIAQQAAPQLKKLSLELGGKNPCLVFADCDFEDTLEQVARLTFSNQGQICLCGSRVLIEASIYDRFRDALVAKVKALKLGDPSHEDTQQGALVSAAHRDKVLSYIELAKQEGGKLLCGGTAAQVPGRCQQGYFVTPTIFEGLDAACRTNHEEIFGPVVTMQPFDNDQQALALANDSNYGLAATVWTQNLSRAHRFSADLECGIVWVNCWMVRDLRTPFGGMKHSGLGREGGLDALRFFTETKNVCHSY